MAEGKQTKSYIATVAWHLSAQAGKGYGTGTAETCWKATACRLPDEGVYAVFEPR